MICFKNLLRFDGEIYQPVTSTSYRHTQTQIANYKGKALTTGCSGGAEICEKTEKTKTELMNLDSKSWTKGLDYPFDSLYVV